MTQHIKTVQLFPILLFRKINKIIKWAWQSDAYVCDVRLFLKANNPNNNNKQKKPTKQQDSWHCDLPSQGWTQNKRFAT